MIVALLFMMTLGMMASISPVSSEPAPSPSPTYVDGNELLTVQADARDQCIYQRVGEACTTYEGGTGK